MKRLFTEGCEADFIVMLLGPTHILATQIRGDYSAHYLFRTNDINAIANQLGYSYTETSSLFFARYSLFYAGRNNLRNFILGKTASGYAAFLHNLTTVSPQPQISSAAIGLSKERFLTAAKIARDHGAQFIFVMAPGFFPAAEHDVLMGARNAGIEILDPAPNGTWSSSLFLDGFHLNPSGASLFTARLGARLNALLDSAVYSVKR